MFHLHDIKFVQLAWKSIARMSQVFGVDVLVSSTLAGLKKSYIQIKTELKVGSTVRLTSGFVCLFWAKGPKKVITHK